LNNFAENDFGFWMGQTQTLIPAKTLDGSVYISEHFIKGDSRDPPNGTDS
jgi:hypothetical protein